MPYKFNPFTGNFDLTENTYTSLFLVDSNGTKWELTVDTAGVLTTTEVADPNFVFMDNTDYKFMDNTSFEFMEA